MWKETTDKTDPTTRDGEWSFELPWLKSNYMPSRYTIRADRGYFVTCFWHGNQAHDFDEYFHYLDKQSAEKAVKRHVTKMIQGAAVTLEQL